MAEAAKSITAGVADVACRQPREAAERAGAAPEAVAAEALGKEAVSCAIHPPQT
ncbi:hypothetical protein LO763_13320 [Glycomyces sp. A-F 0318]|uniref:hypothetical protein n=1 Tax=Glycomyces amatae TaxID=2881355 RepID=UPI001E468833|nr:hypothetical protein [Glycomyces amatae]MCD0444602.1 hypothetical protein [Glycomyces amatae]